MSKLDVIPEERYSIIPSFVKVYSISSSSFASFGNTC